MKKCFILSVLLISVKTLSSQTFDWVRTIGSSTIDVGYAITVDGTGNVYTYGYYSGGILDLDSGPGTYTISAPTGSFMTSFGINFRQTKFITKHDAMGNFIWGKQFDCSSSNGPWDLKTDVSGNVLVSGFFDVQIDLDPGPGSYTINPTATTSFLLKLDAMGNFIWARTFDPGSSSYSQSISFVFDNSGNICLMGLFDGTVDFDPGIGVTNFTAVGPASNTFIVKLDANGNLIWAKSTQPYNTRSIGIDALDNLYLFGAFQFTCDFDPGSSTFNMTSLGGTDVYVSKLDASGNFIWAKQIGGTGNEYNNSGAVDNSGNAIFNVQLTVAVDFDPGPATYTLSSLGSADISLGKLDQNGNFLWAKRMGGTGGDYLNSIVIDLTDNIYSTGFFNGTCDFDPGTGTFNLIANANDSYISKLDPSGSFVSVFHIRDSIGSSCDQTSNDVFVDATKIYSTGSFCGTTNFDTGVSNFSVKTQGNVDMYIHKLSVNSTNLNNETDKQSAFTLYPNPNSGEFTLYAKEKGIYRITNSIGQFVKDIEIKEDQQTINVNGLTEGIYYVIGKTGGGKVIVTK